MAVGALERADDAPQRVDGIRRVAAERSRMQIDRSAAGVDLDVQDPAQRAGHHRPVQLVESAVPHQHRIRAQLLAVLAQVLRQRIAGALLLALDEEADVQRQLARPGQVLHGLDRGHVVALVVARPSREQVSVSHVRLERRRLPFVDRVGRLHVVVAVDRQVRLAGRAVPFGDHDRLAFSRLVDQLRLEAHALETRPQPLGVAQAVGPVLLERADRWDAQLFHQVVEVSVALGAGPSERLFESGGGAGFAHAIPRLCLIWAAWLWQCAA